MQSCMILKIEARPGCTITKGCCSTARETNKNKKVTFKVQQGLNFTVDVEFGFATMISVKQPEGKKKTRIVSFFMTFKTVIFVLVQIEKVIVCKKADFFFVYWVFQFEGHSTQCSKLTGKVMFKRLRKLQYVSKQCM